MFSKVLVSMDLSPATETLVSALPAMREFGTREFALVHVLKPPRDATSDWVKENARNQLTRLASDLEEAGFSASVHVPEGVPVTEVAKAALVTDSDVILVGSRSHTRVREAFIGSVAWDVVRNAGRPVLLQRIEPNRSDPEAALEVHGSGFPKHVVYPTDFSDTANRARPWLLELIKNDAPSFTLLHVIPTTSEEGKEEAEEQLDSLARELRDGGATAVDCQIRVGVPHEEILDAGGNRVDTLVVMGTHGRGFFPGMVLGSVGRQVVRFGSARVLLVPGEVSEA